MALVVGACGGSAATPSTASPSGAVSTEAPVVTTSQPDIPRLPDGSEVPRAPATPVGDLAPSIVADLDTVFGGLLTGVDTDALVRLGSSGDPRVAWLLSDLLRFFQRGAVTDAAVEAFQGLTGVTVEEGFAWGTVTDLLIAWDLPAPPGYVDWKRIPFEIVEPAWEAFFSDADADIDWRLLSWGGVLIDDRPLDRVHTICPEGCIPALDDPAVTDAAGGDWYPDDSIVFGVVVDGEARAYPKNIMEVHEMVNDTLGGRRIGMPYCTLCGAAQAYFTDSPPPGFDVLELRTSGLLSRSNKVMFDLHTLSVFDTFTGEALSGPLQDEDVILEMVSVVTSTWGEWKIAHPETTIVAEDGGIGRFYPDDPLRGRDDEGPIFPIGAVDPRLPVQHQVVGVIAPDGTPIAFPADAARRALEAGDEVASAGVVLEADGGGLRAVDESGEPLPSHQAFWFAWSQFHPDTIVWSPLG